MRRSEAATVVSLGSLRPRVELTAALACVDRVGVAEAAALIRRHKVRGLAIGRLQDHQDHATAADLLAAFEADRTQLARREASLPLALETLTQIASSAGVPIGLMKGVAARRYYDEAGQRDFGDVDIAVNSWADALTLFRQLRPLGYRVHRSEFPWVKVDRQADQLYGQILLFHPSDDMLGMDIHFGGYSVRHCGRIPFAAMTSEQLQYLPVAENVAAVINNAAGDHFVSMKDINDLEAAAAYDPDGARRGVRTARAAKLDHFVTDLESFRAQVMDGPAPACFDGRAARVRLEPAAPVVSDSWNRRLIATTVHSFRVGSQRSLPAAAVRGATAFAYYRKRLSLRQVDRRTTGVLRKVDLNEYTCVRLVPLEHLASAGPAEAGADPGPARETPVADGLSIVHGRAGDLMRLDGHLHVPTVFHEVERSLVREARARQAGPASS